MTGGAIGIGTAGDGAIASLPLARTAQFDIAAEDNDQSVNALTIALTHATTGPLSQPQWNALMDKPLRGPGDTSQTFAGTLVVDKPSTGWIGFSLFWNDLWDETVPALFKEARVKALARSGTITEVHIDDEGFGFGTEAIVTRSLCQPAMARFLRRPSAAAS